MAIIYQFQNEHLLARMGSYRAGSLEKKGTLPFVYQIEKKAWRSFYFMSPTRCQGTSSVQLRQEATSDSFSKGEA
jgi:hypothetical protein